jgi:hypothetical protein
MAEKVTPADYRRISKTNDYYIWHFYNPDLTAITLKSYFWEPNKDIPINITKHLIDTFNVPYFETDIREHYDFLITFKDGFRYHVWTKGMFNSVFLAFRKFTLVSSTWDGICNCPEGLIELIYLLDPKLVSTLSVEKENLE